MEDVINQICEKFGMVYNTAAVNIKILIEKAAKYYIVSGLIEVVISIILLIAAIVLLSVILKRVKESQIKRRDNAICEYSFGLTGWGMFLTIITCLITITFIVLFAIGLDNLIGWNIAPEIKFLDMLMMQAS